MKSIQYIALENAYIDAAAELRSKQVALENQAQELQAFTTARDNLQAHPEFEGELPETYFTEKNG